MSHIYYSVKYSKAFWAIIKGVDPGRDGGGAHKQFLYLGGRLSHYKLRLQHCLITAWLGFQMNIISEIRKILVIILLPFNNRLSFLCFFRVFNFYLQSFGFNSSL